MDGPTDPQSHRNDPRGRGFRDRTSVVDLWALIESRIGRLGTWDRWAVSTRRCVMEAPGGSSA